MNNPEEIPVFLATDDNYAKYAAVVIKSVSQNTKSKPVFCVLTKGLQEDNKRKIAESADGNSVRFFDIDASMFEGFKVDVHLSYITIETCFRYLIPELCPEFDKAVYLDCDTLCLDDIAKFYSMDISDSYAAVARDRQHRDYFNAGVMLFNCSKLRADGMTKKCMQKTREINGVSEYLDQDVLNILFEGRVKFFNPRWHITPFLFSRRGGLSLKRVVMALERPGIVHLCGNDKPWTTPKGINANPFVPLFFYYLKKTPFAEHAELLLGKPAFSKSMRMMFRNPLFLLKRQFYLRLKYYGKNAKKVKDLQARR